MWGEAKHSKGVSLANGDSIVLTLRVQLEGVHPPVWRRLEVLGSTPLSDLHHVLQLALSWQDSHLHAFFHGDRRYGVPFDDDGELIDESLVAVGDLLASEGDLLRYVYDFGDDWLHTIELESMGLPEMGVKYPRCTGGERKTPPEDAGGPPGYALMLEALADPKHEDHHQYAMWAPYDFDPEYFNADATNVLLGELGQFRAIAEREYPEEAPVPAEEDEARIAMEIRDEYAEPVAKLLSMGQPKKPIDYGTLGIGAEHGQELIRLATDRRLHDLYGDLPEVWGPVHAWRVLTKLGVRDAIEPLIELFALIEENDDDWAAEDLPKALSLFGAPALPALARYLENDAHLPYSRIAASSTIAQIGKTHPDARQECVEALRRQLMNYAVQDPSLNAFIVSDLVMLNAVEEAALIEEVYERGPVDLSVLGDWEDVQIDLGLLEKRITPRPRLWDVGPRRAKVVKNKPKKAPAQPGKKKGKKSAQKTSRKKNRKKK